MSVTVDILYQDVPRFEETKHPRGHSGGGKGGQFVRKGEGGGGSPAQKGTEPWTPPPHSTRWDKGGQEAWTRARMIGERPIDFGSEDLHEALRFLRPSHLNKVDRAHRARIALELVQRGDGKLPPAPPPPEEKKVEPPPQREVDPEPPKQEEKPPLKQVDWDELPQPKTQFHQIAMAALKHTAIDGLLHGMTPEIIAERVKAVAATYKHANPSSYANTLLRYLETKHTLPKGSLGKAVPKGAGPGETPPPAKPPPAKPMVQPPATPPSAKPSSYAEIDAAAHTKIDRREVAYHLTAWGKHPGIADIIKNVKPITEVTDNKKKSAYWMAGVRQINMPYSRDNVRTLAVWRHEFGHAIDWELNGRFNNTWSGGGDFANYSNKYTSVLREEGRALVRKHSDNRHAIIERREPPVPDEETTLKKAGLEREDFDAFVDSSTNSAVSSGTMRGEILRTLSGTLASQIGHIVHHEEDKHMFSDFCGAMTLNQIGYGHSARYYGSRPGMRVCEAFANYVSLSQGDHGKVYRAMLHAMAPKLCAGFDEMLEQARTMGPRQPPPDREKLNPTIVHP